MKKIILTTLLAAFVICAFAQTRVAPPIQLQAYRPWAEFNGDIDRYLYTNFDVRSELYVGKTFAQLMSELEIKPIGFFKFVSIWTCGNDPAIVRSIDLVFKYYNGRTYSEARDTSIRVVWETPILNSLVQALEKENTGDIWLPVHYEFFKDMKIKKIFFNPTVVQMRGFMGQ